MVLVGWPAARCVSWGWRRSRPPQQSAFYGAAEAGQHAEIAPMTTRLALGPPARLSPGKSRQKEAWWHRTGRGADLLNSKSSFAYQHYVPRKEAS